MTAVSPSPSAVGPKALDAAGLFERYGQELYRFCLGRLRNPDDAADALQNTFLRVHVALQKGTVPEFEAAWLYKIAHNVCLSRLEQGGRRSRHESATDFEEMEYALAAPEHDHDRLDGLADALSELPHNLRQSLLLREWQGLSYAEIADALGTSVPAVETLLYRARKQLALALEQGGRKARRAASGLLDLFGLRALGGRLAGLLSSAGAAKIVAGAALLAVGGAGIGTAVAVESASRSAPTRLAASISGAASSVALSQASVGTPASSPGSARAGVPDARDSTAPPATPSVGASPSTAAAGAATAAAAVAGTTTLAATIPVAQTALPTLVTPPSLATTTTVTPTLPSTSLDTSTLPSAPTLPAAPSVSDPGLTLPSLPATSTLSTPSLPSTPSAPSLPSTSSLSGAATLPGLGG